MSLVAKIDTNRRPHVFMALKESILGQGINEVGWERKHAAEITRSLDECRKVPKVAVP